MAIPALAALPSRRLSLRLADTNCVVECLRGRRLRTSDRDLHMHTSIGARECSGASVGLGEELKVVLVSLE
eukprot:1344660-Amorphochlora_amoeboformis.AAC.1